MQVHVKTPHIDIQIQGEEYKPLIVKLLPLIGLKK